MTLRIYVYLCYMEAASAGCFLNSYINKLMAYDIKPSIAAFARDGSRI